MKRLRIVKRKVLKLEVEICRVLRLFMYFLSISFSPNLEFFVWNTTCY